MDFTSQYSNQDLAYDLRQRYAKIVGDHLDYISYYRKERDYPNYFRALEDLYTIVQHKFKSKDEEEKDQKEEESKKKKGKKDKDKPKDYKDLREELVKIATDNASTWTGAIIDLEEVAKIEKALRDIERLLLYKMDKANMFGSKRETEGLV